MTIDGGPGPTDRPFGVVDPATGSVFAQAPASTAEQVDKAMHAAETAYRTARPALRPPQVERHRCRERPVGLERIHRTASPRPPRVRRDKQAQRRRD
ncbi:aldehyde dehydrogenase family protein [Saccharopolyspora sp. 5N708]|uniref:aldehyde dehydrogenase family protein n=1 Tax=Saccharopolyspora sp. 5N708 TaxID=3457424 RepID=UPI003FD3046D